MMKRFVHIFFMDGVGLGENDAAVNPLVTADMPHLTRLLGEGWSVARQRRSRGRATFVPTETTVGVEGRPQSATGQAMILTGRNVAKAVGEHYGPKPNPAVAAEIQRGTLFHEVTANGGRAGLLSPYPPAFFEGIRSGRRLLSAVPLAAEAAGVPLLGIEALRLGEAVSPDFTNQAWHDMFGYDDLPILGLDEAGERLAMLAGRYTFSFFEHWPSDRWGHRGSLAKARTHLEMLDTVLGGLLAAWPDKSGLLIITSDHGNIEDKSQRQHTSYPVPTILVGEGHEALGQGIESLIDIAAVVRRYLEL
ncbi:MAG TPA: hypothetical protein VLL52_08135 [Anaerolineae bacterium]|nr:hypothetical protein [Anaerolineae bacterium]